MAMTPSRRIARLVHSAPGCEALPADESEAAISTRGDFTHTEPPRGTPPVTCLPINKCFSVQYRYSRLSIVCTSLSTSSEICQQLKEQRLCQSQARMPGGDRQCTGSRRRVPSAGELSHPPSSRRHEAPWPRHWPAVLPSTRHSQDEARPPEVRAAFNSPFWPFVLATTSVGQEGIDFHGWRHSVVHWNLPANPVDFEQREGRGDRYTGHAIRKNVAAAHRSAALAPGVMDPWTEAFEAAAAEDDHGLGDLTPCWIDPGDAHLRPPAPHPIPWTPAAISRNWSSPFLDGCHSRRPRATPPLRPCT